MNPLLPWLHFPFFLLLVYLLWSSARKNAILERYFWPALLFKLGAGLAYGYLYEQYLRGGDTWMYHHQAVGVVEASKQEITQYIRLLFFNETGDIPLGFTQFRDTSNSFFFIKLLSLFYLLTGCSYWASGLYLSLFSFWGSWYLVERLQRYFPAYGTASVVAFLFFPSVVFWTSGVSKDSVFMGSLCLTTGLFLQLSNARERGEIIKTIAMLCLSGYLLWKIKFFLAAVLLVLLITWFLMEQLTRRVVWFKPKRRQWLAWGFILAVGTFLASFAHPTFTLDFFAQHTVWNYKGLLAITDPDKPTLLMPDLEPTLISILKHAPEAVFQMLFRPYVWEPAPLFYKLAGVENLLLLVLVSVTALYLLLTRKLPRLPLFLAVLLGFFLIGAVLVSLPTPNLGSLYRYRAPLLPFFLMLVLAWGPYLRLYQWLRTKAR